MGCFKKKPLYIGKYLPLKHQRTYFNVLNGWNQGLIILNSLLLGSYNQRVDKENTK